MAALDALRASNIFPRDTPADDARRALLNSTDGCLDWSCVTATDVQWQHLIGGLRAHPSITSIDITGATLTAAARKLLVACIVSHAALTEVVTSDDDLRLCTLTVLEEKKHQAIQAKWDAERAKEAVAKTQLRAHFDVERRALVSIEVRSRRCLEEDEDVEWKRFLVRSEAQRKVLAKRLQMEGDIQQIYARVARLLLEVKDERERAWMAYVQLMLTLRHEQEHVNREALVQDESLSRRRMLRKSFASWERHNSDLKARLAFEAQHRGVIAHDENQRRVAIAASEAAVRTVINSEFTKLLSSGNDYDVFLKDSDRDRERVVQYREKEWQASAALRTERMQNEAAKQVVFRAAEIDRICMSEFTERLRITDRLEPLCWSKLIAPALASSRAAMELTVCLQHRAALSAYLAKPFPFHSSPWGLSRIEQSLKDKDTVLPVPVVIPSWTSARPFSDFDCTLSVNPQDMMAGVLSLCQQYETQATVANNATRHADTAMAEARAAYNDASAKNFGDEPIKPVSKAPPFPHVLWAKALKARLNSLDEWVRHCRNRSAVRSMRVAIQEVSEASDGQRQHFDFSIDGELRRGGGVLVPSIVVQGVETIITLTAPNAFLDLSVDDVVRVLRSIKATPKPSADPTPRVVQTVSTIQVVTRSARLTASDVFYDGTIFEQCECRSLLVIAPPPFSNVDNETAWNCVDRSLKPFATWKFHGISVAVLREGSDRPVAVSTSSEWSAAPSKLLLEIKVVDAWEGDTFFLASGDLRCEIVADKWCLVIDKDPVARFITTSQTSAPLPSEAVVNSCDAERVNASRLVLDLTSTPIGKTTAVDQFLKALRFTTINAGVARRIDVEVCLTQHGQVFWKARKSIDVKSGPALDLRLLREVFVYPSFGGDVTEKQYQGAVFHGAKVLRDAAFQNEERFAERRFSAQLYVRLTGGARVGDDVTISTMDSLKPASMIRFPALFSTANAATSSMTGSPLAKSASMKSFRRTPNARPKRSWTSTAELASSQPKLTANVHGFDLMIENRNTREIIECLQAVTFVSMCPTAPSGRRRLTVYLRVFDDELDMRFDRRVTIVVLQPVFSTSLAHLLKFPPASGPRCVPPPVISETIVPGAPAPTQLVVEYLDPMPGDTLVEGTKPQSASLSSYEAAVFSVADCVDRLQEVFIRPTPCSGTEASTTRNLAIRVHFDNDQTLNCFATVVAQVTDEPCEFVAESPVLYRHVPGNTAANQLRFLETLRVVESEVNFHEHSFIEVRLEGNMKGDRLFLADAVGVVSDPNNVLRVGEATVGRWQSNDSSSLRIDLNPSVSLDSVMLILRALAFDCNIDLNRPGVRTAVCQVSDGRCVTNASFSVDITVCRPFVYCPSGPPVGVWTTGTSIGSRFLTFLSKDEWWSSGFLSFEILSNKTDAIFISLNSSVRTEGTTLIDSEGNPYGELTLDDKLVSIAFSDECRANVKHVESVLKSLTATSTATSGACSLKMEAYIDSGCVGIGLLELLGKKSGK